MTDSSQDEEPNYFVVSNTDLAELSYSVRMSLREGWKVVGPVVVVRGWFRNTYLQTLVMEAGESYVFRRTPSNAEWKEIARRKREKRGDEFFESY